MTNAVHRWLILTVAASVAPVPRASAADPVPLGPPIQVSTDPEGGYDAQVASDQAGNFMVVWQSGDEVRGRRFFATGQPAGDQFLVNDPDQEAGLFGPDRDNVQSVAADAAGNFVVTYTAQNDSGPCSGGGHPCAFAKRFDVDFGIGPRFLVQDPSLFYPEQQAVNTEVAAGGDGNFVVAWEGYDYGLGGPNPYGYGGSGEGTWARQLASSAQPQGSSFLVNTRSDGYQGDGGQLDVAADAAGRFSVVWMSEDSDTVYDGSITLQRFNEKGKPIGGELHVSSDGDYGFDPHVAAAPDGTLMILWADDSTEARIIDPNGVPVGSDFVVTSVSYDAEVAASDASFVAVWAGVSGRVFDLTGAPTSNEFLVTSDPNAENPAVAADAAGNFVVVWKGDDDAIVAQRFQAAAPVPQAVGVTGKSLLLTNKVPDDEEKNKGKWKSSDPAIFAPARGTAGDPRCNADPPGTVKAGVRFLSETSGQDTGLLPLPCQNWTATGSAKVSAVDRRGYRYADPRLADGPCNSVGITGTRSLSVSCKGKGATTDFLYDLMVGVAEGSVTAVLEMGPDRFCSAFPPFGGADGSDGRKFKGKNAPAPATCPAPSLPTPTSIPTPNATPTPTPTPSPGSPSGAFLDGPAVL